MRYMLDKEFEAIKELYNELEYVYDEKIKSKNKHWEENYKHYHNVRKCLGIIQQALTELQAIKEAKPSEALKCVDVLKEDGCITTLVQGKALETIRQYILKAQEQEKENAEYKEVLRIIFEKNVDMFNLKVAIDNNSLRLYNNTISNAFKHLRLTQEEFDLLKRWCEKCQKKS